MIVLDREEERPVICDPMIVLNEPVVIPLPTNASVEFPSIMLLLPVVNVLAPRNPITIFLFPVDRFSDAEYPNSALYSPVTDKPEPYPTAVLPVDVVTAFKAPPPIATLYVPVVSANNVLVPSPDEFPPIPMFDAPVVDVVNTRYPSATFIVPLVIFCSD